MRRRRTAAQRHAHAMTYRQLVTDALVDGDANRRGGIRHGVRAAYMLTPAGRLLLPEGDA